MENRFQYSPAEVAKVRLVKFGILSPDEIRQMSVAQIRHGETTEKGKPKAGGLSDPRLGTINREMKCETCTANMAECPGHFGHFELAKPMFHAGFMKTVLTIMQCVCFNCSKILADEWICYASRISEYFVDSFTQERFSCYLGRFSTYQSRNVSNKVLTKLLVVRLSALLPRIISPS